LLLLLLLLFAVLIIFLSLYNVIERDREKRKEI